LSALGLIMFLLPALTICLITYSFLRWRKFTSKQYFLYIFGLFCMLVFFGSIVIFGALGVNLNEYQLISWSALMLAAMLANLYILIKSLGWKYF